MTNYKHYFNYIRSRKLAREAAMPLNDKRMKGWLKVGGETAEKLKEFFPFVFILDNVGHTDTPSA